jgi:F0F1-type ATP synthase beta subunit
LDGEGDDYPEAAFYMTGTIEEAIEEGVRLSMETRLISFDFIQSIV